MLVNKIIRLEDINTDLVPYLRQLGLPIDPNFRIPLLNSTNFSKHYSEYYNNFTRDFIYSLYKAEINQYNYTF